MRKAWDILLKAAVAFAIIWVILFPFGLAQWSKERYWDLFGLNGSSTVYDYQVASIEEAVYFDLHMCRNGVCLSHEDWMCGFNINHGDLEDPSTIDGCFWNIVDVAPVYFKLERVLRMCGRATMIFAPLQLEISPDTCAEAGGKWAMKPPMSAGDLTLLAQAGVPPS